MFAKVLTSAAVVLLCAQVGWAQTSSKSSKAGQDDEGVAQAAPPASLVGTWKAKTERLPLTGEFNERVWGKNAASVRDVTLTVKANGQATLAIARKVLDARGKAVPGSSSVEEAEVTIGEATPGLATRVNHEVRVVKAERRYPDQKDDRWPLENLKVGIVSFTDSGNTVEVRFEPADGQGSFSETLTRAARAARR
jgi:hypothetical protein